MKATLAAHLETLNGEVSTLGYKTLRGGRVRVFRRSVRRDVNTLHQQEVKNFLRYAVANWRTLTQAQRTAWESYADAHFSKNRNGEEVEASGMSTYVRANFMRQLLGLALTSDAPSLAPPLPLLRLEQLPAQNPDTVGLAVHHRIENLADLLVLVRMTPAGSFPGDGPNVTDYRLVRGVTPDSAQPLPATGGQLLFTPARFIVNDGERYGVEARVVRATDGLASPAVFGDFLKSV